MMHKGGVDLVPFLKIYEEQDTLSSAEHGGWLLKFLVRFDFVPLCLPTWFRLVCTQVLFSLWVPSL